MPPTVSVIIPAYNSANTLERAIRSVLEQNFHDYEVIIIDDGSQDNTADIVKEFVDPRLRYFVHEKNPVEPLGASWNRGWDTAETEYVCIWSLDDCRPYDSLQRQVEILERNPECIMTYGDFMEVPQYGSNIGKRIKTIPYNTFLFQRRFPGGAFMVWRRKVSDQIGYFDEQLQIACDYDLVTRAAVSRLRMCKTSGLVGYFTNESKGLSTIKGVNKEVIERTVVQLRYGMFDKIVPKNILDAEKYRISEILVENNWLSIESFVRDYASFVKRRMFLQKFSGIRRFFMKLFRGAR